MIKYRVYRLQKNGPDFMAAYIYREPIRSSWYVTLCCN